MQQAILEVSDVVQPGGVIAAMSLHTYIVRACGEGMTQAGIHDCDLLLVDRSELASPGEIVVAALNGEALIRRLAIIDGSFALQAASDGYPTLKVEEGDELSIWGVVRQRLAVSDVAQAAWV
ncbi:S24 family peptidase [Pseudomonas sp. GD04087]|uniref:LexA family protein n=1 Tax=Pseudomonas TaxID=286 RepID=UPI001F1BAFC6|nr:MULTISPECIES: S24 family peptidase [Pseudomonas]MDH0292360.1 S24 family peptidase [Pseudomonas sp. GD04087]MDH1048828.1 S24 family peptidase [Pseudomonas sp. GD03903]MDH2001304.1 S24 family peptidase [Pseudomonas sp. GD03691]